MFPIAKQSRSSQQGESRAPTARLTRRLLIVGASAVALEGATAQDAQASSSGTSNRPKVLECAADLKLLP